MTWWLWILFGLTLLVLELFLPTGFFVFLIGIGALLTGLIVALGLAGPLWLHWLLFVVFSFLLLMYVRQYMMGRSDAKIKEADRGPVGQTIVLANDLMPGATGSTELRGAQWMVKNGGDSVLRSGSTCKVIRVEGIQLIVKEEVS